MENLGSFTEFHHKVAGTVFELFQSRFLLIKDFNYDGKGLAPIFIAGTTSTPGGDGEVGIRAGHAYAEYANDADYAHMRICVCVCGLKISSTLYTYEYLPKMATFWARNGSAWLCFQF